MASSHARSGVVFVTLFVLYQSAEGIGARWLNSFTVQAGLMLACIVAAWPLSRWLGYRGFGAWALPARLHDMGWLAGGLLLALVAKAIALLTGQHVGAYAAEPGAASATQAALLSALPMLLLSTFVPSLAEDVLTRGFWYRAAGIRWRRGAAFVGFSSLMYVLNHIYRLDRGPLEWLLLGCFGVAYATALWRTGTLWAAVGLHWGWNLANGILGEMMPVGVADQTLASLLSAAMHCVMALVVLAVSPGAATPRA